MTEYHIYLPVLESNGEMHFIVDGTFAHCKKSVVPQVMNKSLLIKYNRLGIL